jgi:hypothetical protein
MATINYNFGAPSIKKFHELFEGENLITFIDITGFDVIKFDEYMLAKHEDYVDGISLKDFLTDKYSPAASAFIEELIGFGMLYVDEEKK